MLSKQIEMLRGYSGPRLELGMAEQFVLLLSDSGDYSTLLEGHTMQAEFAVTSCQVREALTAMTELARLVLGSSQLKQVLHHLLAVGNYLNHVSP